jgi:hypothetical protein
MANSTLFPDLIRAPLSGDVEQLIKTILSLNPVSQMGFININQMESSDSKLEQQIVKDVAGYGKQLGRVVEALEVLCKKVQGEKLVKRDEEALAEFRDMATKIRKVKDGHMSHTESSVERFLDNLHRLEKSSPGAYEKVRERLRKEVLDKPKQVEMKGFGHTNK